MKLNYAQKDIVISDKSLLNRKMLQLFPIKYCFRVPGGVVAGRMERTDPEKEVKAKLLKEAIKWFSK